MFTKKERNSFFAGMNVGRKLSARNTKKDWYILEGVNENGNPMTVKARGTSRMNALKNAQKRLKRDPEKPNLGLTVKIGDTQYSRVITVHDNGIVRDNWESRYSSNDDNVRAKYTDLSKPVNKKGK
ncbi:MAG: hypothetical protein IJA89_08865 [Clostridia bacterium]|nr:hypothetical protein [Clostridia bacterium]